MTTVPTTIPGALPGATALEVRDASLVKVGDIIANIGTVTARSEVGVFVVLQVVGQRWHISTGMPTAAVIELVRHWGDQVAIERAP